MGDSILQSIVEITRQRDLDSLENSLVTEMAEVVPASSIMLLRYSGDERSEELPVVANLQVAVDAMGKPGYHLQSDPLRIKVDEHLLNCLNERQTVIIDSDDTLARTLIPIFCDGKINGVLRIESSQPLMSDLHTAEAFVEVFNNYQTLFNESERDTLTGLLNRRTFDTKLDRLLRTQLVNKQMLLGTEKMREKRYLGPDSYAWLVIIDIDHFKRVNDTYGHLIGDKVILTLSQLMQEAFRNSDLLFRFGGEEFVVVLEPIIEEMAQLTLDRFRETVANFKFSQVGSITISIGYALVTEGTYPAEVLEQADRALYYAKENGRNCVHDYAELIEASKFKLTEVADAVDFFE